MRKRFFLFLCSSLLLLLVSFSFAQAQELGDYGFRHPELHEHGVIDRLMEKTGTSCCDGGKGGECRATQIKFLTPRPHALLNGVWCPIPLHVKVHLDITLAPGVEAVVCAGTSLDTKGCPSIYCAAAYFSS